VGFDAEEPVVAEEPQEEVGGEFEHRRGAGRPDGCSHRDQVALHELPRVAPLADERAESRGLDPEVQEPLRFAVEPEDVAEHAKERGAEEVAPLGEDRVEGGPAPLDAGAIAPNAEAHDRGLAGDAQHLQKPHETRVGGLVEDDEAGVHVVDGSVHLGSDGAGVSSCVGARLEDGDLVVPVQEVGGHEAGNPRSDHRDLHVISTVMANDTFVGTGSRRFRSPLRVLVEEASVYFVP